MRVVFYLLTVFVTLFACTSVFSQSNGKIVVENRPEHHTGTGFQNHPFVETAAPKGFFFYVRRFWGSVFTPDIPKEHVLPDEEAVRLLNSIEGDRISWLGHATFLIKASGTTILTDPFLSEFASPISWAGPRRFVDPGVSLENLPSIDIIIVSHNHYDHLDNETISNLNNKDRINVVVPLGLKAFFTERGYKKVTELDWHETVAVGNIELTSLPSVHDSARSTDDQNETLWSSWAIESPERKILFIGDSGYSEFIYRNIGKKFGSFDYAILPIGAYEPREVMWMSHVTPEEAVSIGIDVHAKALVASHWGTVSSLSDESPFEPPMRFKKAGIENGFTDQELWIMKIGETRAMLQTKKSNKPKSADR